MRVSTKNCEYCDKLYEFESYRSLITKFCSYACRARGRKNYKHSEETKRKIGDSNSKALSGKPRFDLRGENSKLWKGGKSSQNELFRKRIEYKLWRKAIFERDDYTCQMCGIRGEYLEADHIKPFAYFPELRLELDNGQTLCKPCHLTTDTYSRRYKHEPDKIRI